MAILTDPIFELTMNALKLVTAVVRNQIHRLAGGAFRGGHRTSVWAEADRLAHAKSQFDFLTPLVGPLVSKIGLEVGPGDSLELCRLFLAAGVAGMTAVERFAHPAAVPEGVKLVTQEVERLTLLEASVDFAFSVDVFEHVTDVAAAFRSIARCLKPGGVFVNSIDLRGHNSFKNPLWPLEHLTCPDWLYSLMHSHIVTSNRVRPSGFVAAAESAGLTIEQCLPLASVDPGYLRSLRPRLLSRWRSSPESDLAPTQLLLVCRKPSHIPG